MGIELEIIEEGLRLTGSDSDITIQTFIKAEENGEQVIWVKEDTNGEAREPSLCFFFIII